MQLANKTNGAVVADVPVTFPGSRRISRSRSLSRRNCRRLVIPRTPRTKPMRVRGLRAHGAGNLGLTVRLPVLDIPAGEPGRERLGRSAYGRAENLLSLNLAGLSVRCCVPWRRSLSDYRPEAAVFSRTNPPVPSVDVILELGIAESYVTGFTCASDATKTLTTQTNASVVSIKSARALP